MVFRQNNTECNKTNRQFSKVYTNVIKYVHKPFFCLHHFNRVRPTLSQATLSRPLCRDHFVAGHFVAGPLCRRPLCRKGLFRWKNFYAAMEGRKKAFWARSEFSGVIWFGFTPLKIPAEPTRIRENNKRKKHLKLYQKKIKKKEIKT